MSLEEQKRVAVKKWRQERNGGSSSTGSPSSFRTPRQTTKNKYTKEARYRDVKHAFYKTFNYSREFVASDFQLKLVVTTVATLAVGSEVGDF